MVAVMVPLVSQAELPAAHLDWSDGTRLHSIGIGIWVR